MHGNGKGCMECKLTQGESYILYSIHPCIATGHAVAPCSVIHVSSSLSRDKPRPSSTYRVISPVEQAGHGWNRLTPLASGGHKEGLGIAAEHATHCRWWPKWCHSTDKCQHDRRIRSKPFAWHPHHADGQRFPESPGCGQSFCTLGLCAVAQVFHKSPCWTLETADDVQHGLIPFRQSHLSVVDVDPFSPLLVVGRLAWKQGDETVSGID